MATPAISQAETPGTRPRRRVVASPAKVNLALWVTERRPDGFHDLVSVVVPLAWGDTLEVEVGAPGPDRLFASGVAEGLPTGAENLILRAAATYREAGRLDGAVRVRVTKRIPPGSGLGGGSSNAAAMLQVLDSLAEKRLPEGALAEIAAGLGSDCPLFLAGAPVVMRGRGESWERLPDAAARRLAGRKLLVFRPDFSIATAWAYRQLAADPGQCYTPPAVAEARLAAWLDSDAPLEDLLANSFESVVFRRFLVLPVLLETIRNRWGWVGGLSGSGSACFVLVPPGADTAPVEAYLRAELGPEALVQAAELPLTAPQ